MKLELSKEFKELGYIVIDPVVVRKKKKAIIIQRADPETTGICRLPGTEELYTVPSGAIRIFKNDLAKALFSVEKRFLECKCILDADEEAITFEKYSEEMEALKEKSPLSKPKEIYQRNSKIILPGE